MDTLLPAGSLAPPDPAAEGMASSIPLPDGGRLLVASRRGRLHAHRGDHLEDAVAWRVSAGAWGVAVADGAGSAAHSRLGSRLAAEVAVHEAVRGVEARLPLADALAQAAARVQQALDNLADRAPCAPRELRTTLLVAVGTGEQVALMQVGDGAVICGAPTQGFRQPIATHAGEFSGEVAHFLPDDGAVEALRGSITDIPGNTAVLLLATDGVEDPWYPLPRHAGALLATLAGEPADPPLPDGLVLAGGPPVLTAADPAGALLSWLGFEKRGENDDRTLAVVLRPGVRG